MNDTGGLDAALAAGSFAVVLLVGALLGLFALVLAVDVLTAALP